MHIIFLIVLVVLGTIMPIIDAQRTKKLLAKPITESVRMKFYVEAIVMGWSVLAVSVIFGFFAEVGFGDIGLRGLRFEYNLWFTIIVCVLCGLLFLDRAYKIIGYITSEKFRAAMHESVLSGMEKNPKSVESMLLNPRSKKEKIGFSFVSLTAGICEEIVYRGFLFFLLQTVFPDLHIAFVVLIAMAIFGVGHIYQGVGGILKTAVVGGVFGCLYLATGSLILPIIFHFVVDFSNVFLLPDKEVCEPHKHIESEA